MSSNEYMRRYRAEHPEYFAERDRKYRERNREMLREKQRAIMHGQDIADWWVQQWNAQAGCCYLCGEPLSPDRQKTHIDHDHACHPRLRSCSVCRRGLAHEACNQILGCAQDDPDLLRRIADNAEPVLKATRNRIAQVRL